MPKSFAVQGLSVPLQEVALLLKPAREEDPPDLPQSRDDLQ